LPVVEGTGHVHFTTTVNPFEGGGNRLCSHTRTVCTAKT
jgi:hypothetical protein